MVFRLIAAFKAIVTRIVFGTHSFIAIWQVTIFKKNPVFWYLSAPILLLFFEGVFTLTIKDNQEWKWFCPSVFLYLSSVVPAIWLLELDKVDRRLRAREESLSFNQTKNFTKGFSTEELYKLVGANFKLPAVEIDTETWITLIEQFLMLILIIGRWMLPKGDLTRDQLSQLLLVYIGTAADIIEFFDSFKDDKIAKEPILVLLTLAIWSWSLLQFTVVLTATKSRKSRLSTSSNMTARKEQETSLCCAGCCSIDVWGIILNILLQDAPFLSFRLLLILHYRIISYMNVFFTCKNTLVIVLQLYRLYVVYSETRKQKKLEKKQLQKKKAQANYRNKEPNCGGISIISVYPSPELCKQDNRAGSNINGRRNKEISEDESSRSETADEPTDEEVELTLEEVRNMKRKQRTRAPDKKSGVGRSHRQDTGYSTASSSHGSMKDATSNPTTSSNSKRQQSKATMTSRNDLQPHRHDNHGRPRDKRRRGVTSPPPVHRRSPRDGNRCRHEEEEERV